MRGLAAACFALAVLSSCGETVQESQTQRAPEWMAELDLKVIVPPKATGE